MIKAFTASVLGMMLCFFASSPAASQEEPAPSQEEPAVSLENALSGDEVQKLFAGNTEVGQGMKGEEETARSWTAYYAADGTLRKRETEGHGQAKGIWYVDAEGRSCFKWENKEKTKCDLIIREGDHYFRIRDGQKRGRIRIEEGNTSNL